jgi:hypothetical protein
VGGSGVGLLTSLPATVGGFLGKHWGKALAGATAAGVVVAGVVAGVQSGGDDRNAAAERSTTSDRAGPPATAEDRRGEPTPEAPAPPPDASVPGGQTQSETETEPEPTAGPSGRPGDQPGDQPDDQPDQPNPADEPDHTDGPGDWDDPDDPDSPDDPAPTETAAVGTSARPLAPGLVWDVAIRVTGLAATEKGTLTVTLDRPALGLHLDPRCDLVNLGSLTCRLEGPGTIHLLVTPVPGAVTTLTAALMPGGHRSSVQLG